MLCLIWNIKKLKSEYQKSEFKNNSKISLLAISIVKYFTLQNKF